MPDGIERQAGARLAAAFEPAVSAIEVELCLGSVASTIRWCCLMAARRVADRYRMPDASRGIGRANDVCAHRYHDGIEPVPLKDRSVKCSNECQSLDRAAH